MKLFLISQSENNEYDTYDSAIVCSKSPQDAITIHPNGYSIVTNEEERFSTWVTIDFVSVEYIGKAKNGAKKGVVLSSFNAG